LRFDRAALVSFTNFTTGKSHSFGGIYQELTPQECIRYADKFDDPNLPGNANDDCVEAGILRQLEGSNDDSQPGGA
jgi:uncharacterized protein YndB with AHSA1/START domain